MIDSEGLPVTVSQQQKNFKGNLKLLKEFSILLQTKGVAGWNTWRKENPKRVPDLRGIDLSELDLRGIDLRRAKLDKADFSNAYMWGAILSGAELENARLENAKLQWSELYKCKLTGSRLVGADLSMAMADKAIFLNANLSYAILNGAKLRGADLTGAKVIATAVWGIETDEYTCQDDLRFGNLSIDFLEEYGADDRSVVDEESLRSNNIETAYLLYLMRAKKLTSIVDSLTDNVVLLLGNFKRGRKKILKAVEQELIRIGYLPVLFDFPTSKNRDLVEMVALIAGFSCFVIADISEPRSTGLESMLIVPAMKVPFAPIIDSKKKPLMMFVDLQIKYDWVLPLLKYNSEEQLIRGLEKKLVEPCKKMREKINSQRKKNKDAAIAEFFITKKQVYAKKKI